MTTSNIKTAPIIHTADGFFRRVCHIERMASTGFVTYEAMERNTDILRIDDGTVELMKARYIEIFSRDPMSMSGQFKHACWLHLSFAINRYLMSNAEGRCNGAEKATRHLEMSRFYAAVVRGVEEHQANHVECMAVHDHTQTLTDNLDTEIGFPLVGRPDYDKLAPLFFEKFHTLAMQALR